MSDRMPVGPALEQLRELMAILRELGNAGPRDNSFKQWRQVTLTLLQRLYPGDQTRAVRFRRIPFSAPSARADAKQTRDCYVRGVAEALAFLESLALELEKAGGIPAREMKRPAEAPLAAAAPPAEPVAPAAQGGEPAAPAARRAEPVAPASPASPPQQSGPIEPSPWAPPAAPASPPSPAPASPSASASATRPVTPGKTAPAKHDAGKAGGRSRQRLKDMLGFSDEGAASHASPDAPGTPSAPQTNGQGAPAASQSPEPAAPPASRPPAPIASVSIAPVTSSPANASPPAPIASESAPPGASTPAGSSSPPAPAESGAPHLGRVIPFPTRAIREQHPVTPVRSGAALPPDDDEFDVDGEEFDLGFDLPDDAELDSEPPPPTTLREMLDREPSLKPVAASRVAREVFAMAAVVDQMGVPPGRRAIVRAALIDLGRQLESPPVPWAAFRQALAFMMDYPQVALRIIPMLMPYLDEAA